MSDIKNVTNNNTCKLHSGFSAEITNLKDSNKELWAAYKSITDRIDSFSVRMNVTLGGVAVSCILLAINIFLRNR